jgi:hypothetical protein
MASLAAVWALDRPAKARLAARYANLPLGRNAR